MEPMEGDELLCRSGLVLLHAAAPLGDSHLHRLPTQCRRGEDYLAVVKAKPGQHNAGGARRTWQADRTSQAAKRPSLVLFPPAPHPRGFSTVTPSSQNTQECSSPHWGEAWSKTRQRNC
jgi:hypothetical protein